MRRFKRTWFVVCIVVLTLTVTASGQSSFTITAAPALLSVAQGNQGTSTITTVISGGFNSAISLSASGVPSGTTVSFNPNPIPAPGSGSPTLTITVGSSTPTGTYPITVTGNGGGVQQNATISLTVTWGQGFDFRNTVGYVTDPSNDTYVLSTTAYPTKGSGVTYGWVKTSPVNARDRNAKLDPRLAGINFANNGAPAMFYVDLPSAGTYNLALALGDAGYQACWVQCQVQFLDGSTVLATVTGGTTNLGYFYDAQAKNWSAAAWPASNLSQQVTLAGTRLTVVVGTSKNTGDSTPIAFLGVTQVSGSPNFAISASPSSVTIQQGNQGTSTITTTISGGFNSAIALSASGAPSGTTVSFNPNPIPAPGSGSSTMTITVGSGTPVGTYPITVTGNGGGIQQNTTVTLTVTAQQQPNFTLSASPSSVTIQQGNQGTSTITATISGGFNSAITLSSSGAPSGTTVSFNPNPIPAPGSGSSTMTITVGSSTPTGTYPITVTGNGGGIQQSTTVTLTVVIPPSFTITAAPSSLSIAQGNQGMSTITTNMSGGFNSAISLSASGMPSGTVVSFSPGSIPAPGSGNSTMTMTVGGNTPTGSYPITVTGNGGGIQQNTTVTLTVVTPPSFTITAAPASLSIAQGNQGTSTITTSIGGGFNGAIGLSAAGAPSGTTVNFTPNPIPAPGSGSSTMTITVGSGTPVGTYPITVTGNGGGIQQNTTVTLTVVAPPSFTITAAPALLSVAQGNQGTSTITTAVSGGFNNAISLSASGAPFGTTVTFNPSTIPTPGSGSPTMIIIVGSSTSAGTYPITVTGNGGGIQQNTTVSLTVTSQSGWQQGFNFRNSSNYVTDPPGDTYVLPTTSYPTKANGVTYGWVNTSLLNARDRNAKLDPRLAGINFVNNGSPATFYVDLPSAGTYNLLLALGDAGYQACWVQCQVQFLDGSTVLATVTGGTINLGYFYDAQAKNWSAAVWPTSDLGQQVTLTGTRLTVVVGTSKSTGDSTPIAFLGVAQASGSPNFVISASPSSLTIQQGNQGTSTLMTSISGGFNSAIALSASGAPSGTTVSFNPSTIPAPGSSNSTMTITVGSGTPVGTYPVTVTGNGGGIQQNTTVTLTVTAQQQPNFTISASPASLSIQQGNPGTSTTTTSISGGFNSPVSLSASGMPSGTTVSFNTSPIPSPGSGNATMTVTIGASTPTGTYPIIVTGNGGGVQQSTTVTLVVTVGGTGQAAQVTAIAITVQNGQTFISWNDPYVGSGAGTSNAANYRYNIYRAVAPNCPISSTSDPGVTEVQQGILNDSAILAPQTYHPWNVALRTNLTNQQVTLGSGALINPSGVAVYTATATQTACYGVVTHDITGTLSDSTIVATAAVSESIGTIQPILQIPCTNSARGYCTSGTGRGLLFKLPGSGAAPDPYGDLWSLWGDSTMAFQDGVQRAFTVYQDPASYGAPMVIVDHQDVAWWDTGLAYGGYGSLETYNVGYDYGGYAQTYTDNYFSQLLSFVETNYQPDINHIYAIGTSMGGFGIGIWSIRQPNIFALAIFYHPVWYWNDQLPSMTRHSLSFNLGTETLSDGVTLYNTYSNTPAWLSSNCANNIPFIIHSMGRSDTTTGVGNMWQSAMTAMNAMVTCRYGQAFTWNNGIHGGDPNPIIEFSGYLNIFRKNVSYPAFTGFSLDDNPCASGSPGSSCVIDYTQGACNTGSPGASCHINLGWSWSILSDNSTQWSAAVTNSQITGLNTATANLTPRNTQSFSASPGQTVNWTATGGQAGSVQADSYGLATIPSITFSGAVTIVTLVLQP